MFRKLFFIIFIIAALSAAIFIIYPQVLEVARACSKPITYSIGSFDRKFDISHQELLNAIKEAEDLWEEASDLDLFAYSPEDSMLPINLIHDYRQDTTETLSQLEEVLEQNEETYNQQQVLYDKLKIEYQEAKGAFDIKLNEFNNDKDIYEAEVRAWNKGPRTSKTEFSRIEELRLGLESEAKSIESMQTSLNSMVRDINTLAGRLNDIAKTLNLEVESYNTIGSSRGETFTGGIYYSDERGEGIDIYEFSSHDKLVRILAHELGHALGLDHLEDSGAVMYHLNESSSLQPSLADIRALEALCQLDQ